MSWRDREYAQGRSDWSGAFGGAGASRLLRGNVVTTLIAINIAVFVLCTLTGPRGVASSPIFEFMAMFVPAVMKGEIWRLITAQYLHWSMGHLLMNMLGLHFLGRPLEQEWGSKRFFAIYFIAGTLGMVFYAVLTLIGWLPLNGVAAGASGCVLGLLGACAVRYPHAMVYIYFLFPIKIRTAALFFGGWYLLNLYARGPNAGGDACHLAGMVFGAWWAWWGEQWWDRRGWRLAGSQNRPSKAQVYRTSQPESPVVVDSTKVDDVLRKVYERGIHSLSEAEKEILRTATYRGQAGGSGGADQ